MKAKTDLFTASSFSKKAKGLTQSKEKTKCSNASSVVASLTTTSSFFTRPCHPVSAVL